MGSTRIDKRILVLLTISVAVLAGCTSQDPPNVDEVSVKLSWSHSVQFLGFYVAEEFGYYADENLAVTLEPLAGTFEMDSTPGKVASTEFDFGVGGSALILSHQDLPLTVVAAIYQFSPAALFARVETGINTPEDLAGHTVAIKSASWETLIDGLLEGSGVSPDQIIKVEAGFDMQPFYDGEVDVWSGWITNEVVVARLQGLDLITLPLYEYGIKNNDNMIYTSQTLADSNADLIERFLRATLKGWEWAVNNPIEAVDIYVRRFPSEADNRSFHQNSFAASIPLIVPHGKLPGDLDCQAGQFRNLVLSEGFCDSSFLRSARMSESQ